MGKESRGNVFKEQMKKIKDRNLDGAAAKMRNDQNEKKQRLKSRWEHVIIAEINNGLSVEEIYKKHNTLMSASLGFDSKKYIEYLYAKSKAQNVTKRTDPEDR